MLKINNSEMPIMKYLWDEEEKAGAGFEGRDFRSIRENYGKTVAKQTVNTLLVILRDKKGLVYSTGEERSRLYHTALTREGYAWKLLEEIYDETAPEDILDRMKKEAEL